MSIIWKFGVSLKRKNKEKILNNIKFIKINICFSKIYIFYNFNFRFKKKICFILFKVWNNLVLYEFLKYKVNL